MKKISIIMIFVLTLTLVACGSGEGEDSASGEAEMKFVVGSVFTETDIGGVTMKEFEEYVEKESDGRIDVEVHYNGALGGEREMLEGLKMGTVNMCFPATTLLTQFDKKFSIYEQPFLFSTMEEVNEAFTGELSEVYDGWLEDYGYYNFGWGLMGFAGISNDVREVKTPDDLKGLKIRVMESEEYVNMFKYLGANPVTMSYDEVYTALQQGTIDGQDNPPIYTVEPGFYEVQSYYTKSNHRVECAPYLASLDYMNGLDPEFKEIIDAGMSQAVTNYNDRAADANEEFLKVMEDAGLKITELTDEERALFVEKSKPMYDDTRKIVGDEIMDLALSYSKK